MIANLPSEISLEVISAILAVIALLLSIQSNWYARRALNISETEHAETRQAVALYMMQGLRIRKAENVFASFALSVTNRSSTPETLTRFELKIFFKDGQGELRCTIADSEVKAELPTTVEDVTQLKSPLNLGPKSTEQGWISFRIPQVVETEMWVEKYQICAITSNNSEATWDSYVLSEITKAT